MQNSYIERIIVLLKRLLIIYAVYGICRLLFYFFNYGFFKQINLTEYFFIQFYALRFDTFSVLIGSSLFILLSLLPFQFTEKTFYKNLQYISFIVPNSLFVLLNMIDIGYFPYIKTRSTADLLKQAGGQTDLMALLPRYLLDYWYLLLIFLAITYAITWAYKRIQPKQGFQKQDLKKTGLNLGYMFLLTGIMVIGIRGGLQRVPIDVIDAGKYTKPQFTSLLLNSPFTLIKSLEKDELSILDFGFKPAEIKSLYNPIYQHHSDSMKKLNIVVLILESFSKEYTALSKQATSYTPFFDSLSQHAMRFTNAFSNGHKSIEGIPAILSGVPSLMANPFINSTYACNQYQSLASILTSKGYSTAFFHGGFNGTMNFDSYALQAGYQNYYGKNEYNNDADFDGYWGIWDEPFLQFSIKKINSMQQPFHSAIFTLSSHHPYLIPSQYKGKFKKGTLEIHESIGYADYALKKFFETASKQSWFQNTLFVLSADHCSISQHPFFRNNVGQFAIPVLFYMPTNKLDRDYPFTFQQMDIMPSILSLMNYDQNFFCFGKSFSDSTGRKAHYYTSSTHYMLDDSMAYTFSNYNIQTLYNYKSDSLLEHEIKDKTPYKNAEIYFRAFMQTYNNSLVNNACETK